MQLKLFGALGLLGLGALGMSEADKYVNYIETSAIVTSVNTDCYIEAGGRKVVDQRTNELAYMDCEVAPRIAMIHGHSATHIKRRNKIEYKYNSPMNGAPHTGFSTIAETSMGLYRMNQNIRIYVHQSDPYLTRL
ncbi:MAG: hypothetical protein AAF217_10770 [Pseudomonadota bacterium]